MEVRRKGFTLIELLVVIAIIGILAAMLFPVFARARESARKIQCLSNVKNVALAIQMYLTDYDRLMPNETSNEALVFFANDYSTGPGGDNDGMNDQGCQERAYDANPFLRPAVILDDYVKNRDIYRCPSAKNTTNASWIVPGYNRLGPGGYLQYEKATQGTWGRVAGTNGPCNMAWPTGWGGTVTDSILQGIDGSSSTGAVEVTININVSHMSNAGMSVSQISDPARFVACGDTGGRNDRMDPALLAYPDICILACASPTCWQADWDNCPWTRDCGARLETKLDKEGLKAFARHLGGSNVGFMDGHARWMPAQAILNQSPRWACGCWGGGLVQGELLGWSDLGFPTSAAGKPEWGVEEGYFGGTDCGQIPLY
jgi:prepilin-type N-terminal cleavage/methylation domain-containing protein/prepilin-type processing-associated H-X9-DG protein